jgi:hypothetical protein
MGGKILLQHPYDSASKHRDVKYRRQRDKALRLLIFTSDRIRIIFTAGILKAAKELLNSP